MTFVKKMFQVMDSFEREDIGKSPLLAFEAPPNNIDFDDFHPYPLTFKDALLTHDVPRLSEVFTSVLPINVDFGHEEVDTRDRDIVFEWFEMDWRNVAAAPNGNDSFDHSSREASSSGLSSAPNSGAANGVTANGVTANGVAIDDGTGSHEFDDGVPGDISFDDADTDELDSDDSVSEIHNP